ncbi:NAD dependent epimerase/dehydratase family [Synechococcus sp. PCC 7335]|uniref:bifunctional sterol desaturase/short chain dehydrogenase n=1 Tax=Synechococcus sp. (strain ATCC 29403 / PCC 7335) TaxID=91464 RepID=UPI00017EC39D|nr:bifunctional sterol desaturase/short chain dehydrogenase [Synechococcus sp. PCC 7335]EDX85159.1 NAD dependent epimerase/dehydratase family [Synechococcus sp. PCC 7335]
MVTRLLSPFEPSFLGLASGSLVEYGVQLVWAIAAVFLVEMVRDFYHVLSHQWAPLQRLHGWHHRAYKKDFSPINTEIYRKAQLYNDAPESIFMMGVMAIAALVTHKPGLWAGVVYAAGFLVSAVMRSRGLFSATDLTHEPGPLTGIPGYWRVNRTYHWRHHFDDTSAYYAGLFPISDKILGTALSLKGKSVAVTGASGTLGRALIRSLAQAGAKPIALTTSNQEIPGAVKVLSWQTGKESELKESLQKIDILIINHGINVMGANSSQAIEQSLEVNALSAWRLMETFLETVDNRTGRATKEVWVNTSEAEVNPAFSPLYEISKRLMGDLINLRRTDAPCVIRKLVLGPFKSNLNPYGVMSADAIARIILFLAKRDIRNIIVTINPLTYLLFPIKEIFQAVYFKLFLIGEKRKSASEKTISRL